MLNRSTKLRFIPSVILALISAYSLAAGFAVARNGGDYSFYWNLLIVSLVAHALYFAWLLITKRAEPVTIASYVIISLLLFIVFVPLISRPPIFRQITFEMGPDPFFPSSTISSAKTFNIWEKEFWSQEAQEQWRKDYLKQIQTARQGSLIGHVGTDLQGWSVEKIRYAFGEPAKIIAVEKGLEKWIYHPWTDHTDWEMPVYVNDGLLLKIGD